MAKADIEQLKADGLNPTVDDIIRLNSLALKFEREKGKAPTYSIYMLPRISTIGEGVYFRQPTVGHEIWIDAMARYIDSADYNTKFAVTAYALSKELDDLPNPDDFTSLQKCLEEFKDKMKNYSSEQIEAAVNYCENGYKPEYGEFPERVEDKDSADISDVDDYDFCVALGVLNDGVVQQLGITLGEMKRMTRERLEQILKYVTRDKTRTIPYFDFKKVGQYELGQYYHTLDVIRERLTKEKQMKEGI